MSDMILVGLGEIAIDATGVMTKTIVYTPTAREVRQQFYPLSVLWMFDLDELRACGVTVIDRRPAPCSLPGPRTYPDEMTEADAEAGSAAIVYGNKYQEV